MEHPDYSKSPEKGAINLNLPIQEYLEGLLVNLSTPRVGALTCLRTRLGRVPKESNAMPRGLCRAHPQTGVRDLGEASGLHFSYYELYDQTFGLAQKKQSAL